MLSIVRIARFAVVGALAGCTFDAPNAAPDGAPDVPPSESGRVVDDHLIAVWRFAEGSGTTEDVQRGVEQLHRLGANVLGVVYNKARGKPGLPSEERNSFMSAYDALRTQDDYDDARR